MQAHVSCMFSSLTIWSFFARCFMDHGVAKQIESCTLFSEPAQTPSRSLQSVLPTMVCESEKVGREKLVFDALAAMAARYQHL